MSNYQNDISLVISTCDKYEDAWYPYFELIKKYWPEHPKNTYLISETKQYFCDGMNIISCNYGDGVTWSERLYRTLDSIPTKYIIFSLEDFFLQDYVKQDRIQQCYDWMEENSDIAVCRLCSSNHEKLVPTEKYSDFYLAKNDVGFRLETQFALWNRETLMSFIDRTENPWEFEEKGSERIKNTDKLFLWHYVADLNPDKKIFNYSLAMTGYGITWGHWLWNNKKLFEENGIHGVKYYRLGVLSERTYEKRMKHLYNTNQNGLEKAVKPFWKMLVDLRKVRANILVFGFLKGLHVSWNSR